jgi:hypothetical protein
MDGETVPQGVYGYMLRNTYLLQDCKEVRRSVALRIFGSSGSRPAIVIVSAPGLPAKGKAGNKEAAFLLDTESGPPV